MDGEGELKAAESSKLYYQTKLPYLIGGNEFLVQFRKILSLQFTHSILHLLKKKKFSANAVYQGIFISWFSGSCTVIL